MTEIFKRYSLRTYLDQPVEREKIDQLIKAGFQAPSAHNQQAWEVLVLDDAAVLNQLAEVAEWFICLKNSPLAIVTLANENDMARDVMWQQDMAALTQNILLEAVSLDLGGVWLGVAPLEDRMARLRQILDLPEHIRPFSIISLGYPTKERTARPRTYDNKIFFGKYGQTG